MQQHVRARLVFHDFYSSPLNLPRKITQKQHFCPKLSSNYNTILTVVFVLMLMSQSTIFSHVGGNSCLPGLNQYMYMCTRQRLKCLV